MPGVLVSRWPGEGRGRGLREWGAQFIALAALTGYIGVAQEAGHARQTDFSGEPFKVRLVNRARFDRGLRPLRVSSPSMVLTDARLGEAVTGGGRSPGARTILLRSVQDEEGDSHPS